jgi:hypothetical protein
VASEEGIQELIKVRPFLGIDPSTNQLEMKPGFAIQASNVNTSIIRGAMLPERGRTELFDAAAATFVNGPIVEITVLYPVVGPNNAPGVIFQGVNSTGGLCTGYYDYNTAVCTDITNPSYPANPFTQAIQFLNVVYTNGGQRFFPGNENTGGLGVATQLFEWQYPAPVVLWNQPPVPVPNIVGPNFVQPNNVSVNWTYAIATTGFGAGGKIQNGDVLTTTITTDTGGPQAITYTVGSTVGVPDSSFTILAGHIADYINAWYAPGGPGAGLADKVTATVFTNFDTQNVPGVATAQNPVGVLISSNASGLKGNAYTVATSMSANSTEMYQIIPPTPSTSTTEANFFGADTGVGNMLGGYYFYLFTRVTQMPDGTASETSVLLDAQAAANGPIASASPDDPLYQTYPPRYLNKFFPAAYDAPLQVSIGEATYGSNSAVTFYTGPYNYLWTGTNPDGTTFTTNIYRASSLQDNFIYQFVGNVSNQPPPFGPSGTQATGTFTITGSPLSGHDNVYVIGGQSIPSPQVSGRTTAQQAAVDAGSITNLSTLVTATSSGNIVTITANAGGTAGNGITTTASGGGGDTVTANQAATAGGTGTGGGAVYAFRDTFSDLDISGNAVLTVHRDPPPFVAPYETLDHTPTYNFGFMQVHQNRVWALVEVMVPVTAAYEGVQYIYQIPQVQLWYSNLARGWEWNISEQVLLLNNDVVSTIAASSTEDGYLGPNYDANYGNMPKALTEVGTELMASMKRQSWVVWGDGSSANPYIAKPSFSYGALAGSTGVLGVRGGMYFVTESGDVFWYDGSAPAEKSTDINAAVKLTSLGANLTYADLGQSCLSYSNDVLYWSFPTKGYTYSYDTKSNTWMSQLPYAPASRYAVASSPWNPATLAALLPNEVLATRTNAPTIIDQWFSDPNGDALTNYQLYSWTTPYLDSGKPDWTKWYALVRVMAPKQPGIVTVSITVDNGDEPQQTFSRSFDLGGSQKSLTAKLIGETQKIIGYYARMTVSVQSIPGEPAPVIWGVSVYGSPSIRLQIENGGA